MKEFDALEVLLKSLIALFRFGVLRQRLERKARSDEARGVRTCSGKRVCRPKNSTTL